MEGGFDNHHHHVPAPVLSESARYTGAGGVATGNARPASRDAAARNRQFDAGQANNVTRPPRAASTSAHSRPVSRQGINRAGQGASTAGGCHGARKRPRSHVRRDEHGRAAARTPPPLRAPTGGRPVRVVSWNVGLRGLRGTATLFGGMAKLLAQLRGDIVCFQEVKLTRKDITPELASVPGYSAYFCLPRKNVGYSGVATYCSTSCTPARAEAGWSGALYSDTDDTGRVPPYGAAADDDGVAEDVQVLSALELDSEGRVVVTDHQSLVLLNVYFPASRCGNRHGFKVQFHAAVEARVRALQAAGRRVVVAGDFNVTHRELDHCDPGAWTRETGRRFHDHHFRRWMTALTSPRVRSPAAGTSSEGVGVGGGMGGGVDDGHGDVGASVGGVRCAGGGGGGGGGGGSQRQCGATGSQRHLVDAFRLHHPAAKAAYTWWDARTGARKNNYGVRLDYVLVDSALVAAGYVHACTLLRDVDGSDHCPVAVQLAAAPVPSMCTPPSLAATCAAQHNLRSFFKPGQGAGVPAAPSVDGRGAGAPDTTASGSSVPTTHTAQGLCGVQGGTGARRAPPAHGDARKPRALGRLRGGSAGGGGGVKRKRRPQQSSISSFFGGGNKARRGVAGAAAAASSLASKSATAPPRTLSAPGAGTPSAAVARSASTGSGAGATARRERRDDATSAAKAVAASLTWGKLLSGPLPPPVCHCGEPTVERTVLKDGPTCGRLFYVCRRPEGKPGTPGARCSYFMWASDHRRLGPTTSAGARGRRGGGGSGARRAHP